MSDTIRMQAKLIRRLVKPSKDPDDPLPMAVLQFEVQYDADDATYNRPRDLARLDMMVNRIVTLDVTALQTLLPHIDDRDVDDDSEGEPARFVGVTARR